MLYWLSFAAPDKNLGVVIVEAEDSRDAIAEANGRKLNPGGEVLVFPIPEPFRAHAHVYQNRLMQRDEAERLFGPTASHEELKGAVAAGDADLVCGECNDTKTE